MSVMQDSKRCLIHDTKTANEKERLRNQTSVKLETSVPQENTLRREKSNNNKEEGICTTCILTKYSYPEYKKESSN